MKSAIKILLSVIALFTYNRILAQAPLSEGEQQIKYYLDQIQYWRYQYSPDDSGVNPDANPTDSLIAMNKALVNYLIANTALLYTNFKTLDEAGMKIATSEDKKLRFYSWDTEMGDEKHMYGVVAQYASGSEIKGELINDFAIGRPGSLYTEVHDFGSERKIYVAFTSAIRSQKDAAKIIFAYDIYGGKLSPAGVFPGTFIEYVYDYFSNYDYKSMKEKNVPHVEKGKLYIPTVNDDKITGGWSVYEFDGNQFKLK